MKSITIDKTTAQRLYVNATGEFKEMLESEFGRDDLLQQKITDRVKGFDDILRISGHDASEFNLRQGETPWQLASRKVELIAEVYNEGTVLNAGNTSQNKYYPWFEIVKDKSKPSGFGLSCLSCGGWYSTSSVGVRLCYKSSELAIDAGKKFITEYEDMLIR